MSNTLKHDLIVIGIVIVLIIIGVTFINKGNSTKIQTVKEVTKPIETTINKVDSITKINNTIVNNITKIDSIKHEELIRIKTLSDDSTLIVFYELLQDK